MVQIDFVHLWDKILFPLIWRVTALGCVALIFCHFQPCNLIEQFLSTVFSDFSLSIIFVNLVIGFTVFQVLQCLVLVLERKSVNLNDAWMILFSSSYT